MRPASTKESVLRLTGLRSLKLKSCGTAAYQVRMIEDEYSQASDQKAIDLII